jgi:replication factor C small subunit
MRSKSQQTKGNVTSVKDFARTLSLGEVSFKIIFLDEADALTSDAQQALRRTMEKYSNNARFILSCNYSSRIIEPIQSRCAVFRFTALTDDDLKKIIKRVAGGESITVTEDGEKALLYVATGDARKVINCLQAVAGLNKKVNEEEVFKVASRARPREVSGMIQNALNGEFMKARKDLQELMIKYGMNGEDVINQVYQEVVHLEMQDELKVTLIDKIGEYDYRLVEGANERIQLEALLAQIMLAGKKAK